MTVSSPSIIAGPFNTDGSTVTFSFGFDYISTADVVVQLLNKTTGIITTLVLGTDYTQAAGAGDGDSGTIQGGSVTIQPNAASGIANGSGQFPAGYTLTISRNRAYLQPQAYPEGGPFPSEAVELGFDSDVILMQQNSAAVGNALKFPLVDGTGFNTTLPPAVLRAGKYLAFDGTGAPIMSAGTGLMIAPFFEPTGSGLPTSGNGLYLPGANSPAIAANGGPCVVFANPSNVADFLQICGSVSAAIGYVSLSATGVDSAIGFAYQTHGTTTVGSQYLQTSAQTTGTHDWYINGVLAMRLTDTSWNPNVSYAGPCNGYPLISSGQGVTNGGPGPDIIGAVYSVQSPIYKNDGSGTASGASIIVAPLGPTGMVHFAGNGWLGHFTVQPPTTNPNGNDRYGAPNSLSVGGTAAGGNVSPAIFSAPSGNPADTNIGLTYYNYGVGPHLFSLGNLNRSAFQINWASNYVNGIAVTPGATGVSPVLYGFGGAGNIRLSLSGIDDAGVDICNRLGAYPLAKFSGGFQPADYFQFTAGQGSSGAITMAAVGTDTNIDIALVPQGTGLLKYGAYTAGVLAVTGSVLMKTADGTNRRLLVG